MRTVVSFAAPKTLPSISDLKFAFKAQEIVA